MSPPSSNPMPYAGLPEQQYGDYLVFVDESGDHGLATIDPSYPIFVLVFCLIKKADYVASITPAIQNLKFKHWGHDMVVLHEHEIRKPAGAYGFLQKADRRQVFIADVTNFVEQAPLTLIAGVIHKQALRERYVSPNNPYTLCLEFGLERLHRHLESLGQAERITPVIVEMRGQREDRDLELEFRRIADGANYLGRRLPFQMVIASKLSNCAGLQLADLVARPIGIRCLRPEQPNRAYEIIETKFRRSPAGEIRGWGLKVFP